MGYYMRYLFEGQPEIRLEDIESALKKVDEGYAFVDWENDRTCAEIRCQDEVYGFISLEHVEGHGVDFNNPLPTSGYSLLAGGELDEEIEELVEKVELVKGLFVKKSRERVLEFLKQVKVRIVVQVLWGGREGDETLDKLDPIWEWLMAKYKGLLYAEGEGFYEGKKLMLKVR